MPDDTVAEAPQTEEPDVPVEELEARNAEPGIESILNLAALLTLARANRKLHEEEEAVIQKKLLPLMQGIDLHGVRLRDGTAVRRRWNPNRPTIDPGKLAAKCADYKEFIESKVVVDQAKLRSAYPELWRELGGKLTEGVAVYEPKKGKPGGA